MASARGVLRRLTSLGVGVGAAVGVSVWALQLPIASFFSKDALVIQQVSWRLFLPAGAVRTSTIARPSDSRSKGLLAPCQNPAPRLEPS